MIVVEKGASIDLLVCDHTADADRDYLVSQVVEIQLEQGATLNVCDIEEDDRGENGI